MFLSLQVEDTSEDADDQACITSQPASANPLIETGNSVQYGIEEDEKMAEIDFAIFSVFEDVHRLRAETQRLWARLKDGDMSLIQATLSLAAMMELVGENKFFWASDYPHPDHPGNYLEELRGLIAPMKESGRRAILGENVAKAYKLEV